MFINDAQVLIAVQGGESFRTADYSRLNLYYWFIAEGRVSLGLRAIIHSIPFISYKIIDGILFSRLPSLSALTHERCGETRL